MSLPHSFFPAFTPFVTANIPSVLDNLKALNDTTTLCMGLRRLQQMVEGPEGEKHVQDLARVSPSWAELWAIWDRQVSGSDTEVSAALLSSLATLLRHPLSAPSPRPAAAAAAAESFEALLLTKRLRALQFHLGSSDRRRCNAALELALAIAGRGEASAGLLARSLDFGHASIAKMARPDKRAVGGPSFDEEDPGKRPTRAGYLKLTIVLLRSCDAGSLEHVLRERALLSGALHHVGGDPADAVQALVEAVSECVVSNVQLPEWARSAALTDQALSQLGQAAARLERGKSDASREAAEACLSLLQTALTDVSCGLCPPTDEHFFSALFPVGTRAPGRPLRLSSSGAPLSVLTAGAFYEASAAAADASPAIADAAAPAAAGPRIGVGARPLLDPPSSSPLLQDPDLELRVSGCRRVLRALLSLQPASSQAHAALVAAALHGRPSLAVAYLEGVGAGLGLEQAGKGAARAVAGAAVLGAALKESGPGWASAAPTVWIEPIGPEVQIDIRAVLRGALPPPAGRHILTRLLQTRGPAAKLAGLEALSAVLQAAEGAIRVAADAIERRGAQLGLSAHVRSAMVRQLAATCSRYLRASVPDPQAVIGCISVAAAPAAEGEKEAAGDKGKAVVAAADWDLAVDGVMEVDEPPSSAEDLDVPHWKVEVVALRCLAGFCRVCPEATSDANIEPLRLLPAPTEDKFLTLDDRLATSQLAAAAGDLITAHAAAAAAADPHASLPSLALGPLFRLASVYASLVGHSGAKSGKKEKKSRKSDAGTDEMSALAAAERGALLSLQAATAARLRLSSAADPCMGPVGSAAVSMLRAPEAELWTDVLLGAARGAATDDFAALSDASGPLSFSASLLADSVASVIKRPLELWESASQGAGSAAKSSDVAYSLLALAALRQAIKVAKSVRIPGGNRAAAAAMVAQGCRLTLALLPVQSAEALRGALVRSAEAELGPGAQVPRDGSAGVGPSSSAPVVPASEGKSAKKKSKSAAEANGATPGKEAAAGGWTALASAPEAAPLCALLLELAGAGPLDVSAGASGLLTPLDGAAGAEAERVAASASGLMSALERASGDEASTILDRIVSAASTSLPSALAALSHPFLASLTASAASAKPVDGAQSAKKSGKKRQREEEEGSGAALSDGALRILRASAESLARSSSGASGSQGSAAEQAAAVSLWSRAVSSVAEAAVDAQSGAWVLLARLLPIFFSSVHPKGPESDSAPLFDGHGPTWKDLAKASDKQLKDAEEGALSGAALSVLATLLGVAPLRPGLGLDDEAGMRLAKYVKRAVKAVLDGKGVIGADVASSFASVLLRHSQTPVADAILESGPRLLSAVLEPNRWAGGAAASDLVSRLVARGGAEAAQAFASGAPGLLSSLKDGSDKAQYRTAVAELLPSAAAAWDAAAKASDKQLLQTLREGLWSPLVDYLRHGDSGASGAGAVFQKLLSDLVASKGPEAEKPVRKALGRLADSAWWGEHSPSPAEGQVKAWCLVRMEAAVEAAVALGGLSASGAGDAVALLLDAVAAAAGNKDMDGRVFGLVAREVVQAVPEILSSSSAAASQAAATLDPEPLLASLKALSIATMRSRFDAPEAMIALSSVWDSIRSVYAVPEASSAEDDTATIPPPPPAAAKAKAEKRAASPSSSSSSDSESDPDSDSSSSSSSSSSSDSDSDSDSDSGSDASDNQKAAAAKAPESTWSGPLSVALPKLAAELVALIPTHSKFETILATVVGAPSPQSRRAAEGPITLMAALLAAARDGSSWHGPGSDLAPLLAPLLVIHGATVSDLDRTLRRALQAGWPGIAATAMHMWGNTATAAATSQCLVPRAAADTVGVAQLRARAVLMTAPPKRALLAAGAGAALSDTAAGQEGYDMEWLTLFVDAGLESGALKPLWVIANGLVAAPLRALSSRSADVRAAARRVLSMLPESLAASGTDPAGAAKPGRSVKPSRGKRPGHQSTGTDSAAGGTLLLLEFVKKGGLLGEGTGRLPNVVTVFLAHAAVTLAFGDELGAGFRPVLRRKSLERYLRHKQEAEASDVPMFGQLAGSGRQEQGSDRISAARLLSSSLLDESDVEPSRRRYAAEVLMGLAGSPSMCQPGAAAEALRALMALSTRVTSFSRHMVGRAGFIPWLLMHTISLMDSHVAGRVGDRDSVASQLAAEAVACLAELGATSKAGPAAAYAVRRAAADLRARCGLLREWELPEAVWRSLRVLDGLSGGEGR